MSRTREGNRDALKQDWNDFKSKRLDERVAEEWRAFLEWKKQHPIDKMSLDHYTSLLAEGGGTYFTNLIERKTAHCGRFRAASSASYGIYRTRANDGSGDEAPVFSSPFSKNGRLVKERELVNHSRASADFEAKVRPVLEALSQCKDLAEWRPLDLNFVRKVAYMYNPDRMLALYKTEVIRRIERFLGIKEAQVAGYKDTEAIKSTLTEAWGVSVANTCSWTIDELQAWGLDGDDIRLTREFEVSQKMSAFLYLRFGATLDFEHKNQVYFGPPGTGKTHRVTEAIAQRAILEDRSVAEMSRIVQFHPSYSYEDFIEGLKPVNSPGGGIALVHTPGIFMRFCDEAMKALREDRMDGKKHPRTFYFVADEINRAELSRVLGEVLVCLEESKRIDFDRDGQETGLRVTTQYGYMAAEANAGEAGPGFGVPANLYFIGTMNDIDRSIDSFDMALRRRFAWVRTACDYEVIRESVSMDERAEVYERMCEELNTFIRDKLQLGESYEIGHAYFMTIAERKITAASLGELFDTRIEPLLSEYLRAEHSPKDIKDKLQKARAIFSLNAGATSQ
jgi:5-methylcytosine-specific restriction protein B